MARSIQAQVERYLEKLPFNLCPDKIDKGFLYTTMYDTLTRCVLRTFVIDDVPDVINYNFMMLQLLCGGRICFFNRNSGELTALNANSASEPDLYYIPRKVLVVSPYLTGEYILTPGVDCEVVYCTSLDQYRYMDYTIGGIKPLLMYTADLLADTIVSISVAIKNIRLCNVLAADDQLVVDSIKDAVQKMYNGEPYLVVQSSLVATLQSFPVRQNVQTNELLQLIELYQYIWARFYEQIGIKTHDNMKKERMITAEVDEGADMALFNIDDLKQSITEGLNRVNKMFGTSMRLRVNPLIQQQAEAPQQAADQSEDGSEPAAEPALDPAREDPAPEAADDPAGGDFMQAIYQAAALRVAEMIRGAPSPDPEPEDEEPDGSETEPDDQTDDQSEDGSEPAEELQEIADELQEIAEDLQDQAEEVSGDAATV
ncbi:MAG: hypothetical protein J6S41_07810 [Clostridia bacterium]|nr:hypothetical protein [Clostridia bacterium]